MRPLSSPFTLQNKTHKPKGSQSKATLPIVAYAMERRLAAGKPDYWDYATRLELAMLASDHNQARAALSQVLASVRESWEPQTTLNNLRLLRESRERRKEFVPWAQDIEKALEERTQVSAG